MSQNGAQLASRNVSTSHLMGVLVRTQIRELLRTRRTQVLVAVQFLPVLWAIGMVLFGNRDGLATFSGMVDDVILAYLLPLVAIYLGAPTIVEEIEGRTLTYLLLRPLGKIPVFVGKVMASVVVASLSMVIPLLLLFAICFVGSSDLVDSLGLAGRVMLASVAGGYAYVCIFSALGALFSSSLTASVLYFFVVEMVVGRLPMLELLSVRFHLRAVAGFDAERAEAIGSLFLDEPLRVTWWLGAALLFALGTVALGIGARVFQRKAYHL